MYRVTIIRAAQRDLDDLAGELFDAVNEAVVERGIQPRPHGSMMLSGREGYRIRVRDMRVLYRIDDEAKEVIVYRVKHRREVCR